MNNEDKLYHPRVLKDTYRFKGQESIDEWTKKIEDVALGMEMAVDRVGLCVHVSPDPMVVEFLKAAEKIKKYMNS